VGAEKVTSSISSAASQQAPGLTFLDRRHRLDLTCVVPRPGLGRAAPRPPEVVVAGGGSPRW
jgi:hypothetical protein